MSIGVASDMPLEARGFLLQMHAPTGAPREQKAGAGGSRLDTVDDFESVLLALPRGPPAKTWYCGALLPAPPPPDTVAPHACSARHAPRRICRLSREAAVGRQGDAVGVATRISRIS